MSAVMKPRRSYRKMVGDHKRYAEARFAEFASVSAVQAEIQATWGVKYEHNHLNYYWTKANPSPKRAEARECAVSSDSDGGDEQP